MLVLKNPPADAGDARVAGSIMEWGRAPGVGNTNPLQYSCLHNSMGRRGWVDYRLWGHKELDSSERWNTTTCSITVFDKQNISVRSLTW